jgi:DNA recombination protein RmuC
MNEPLFKMAGLDITAGWALAAAAIVILMLTIALLRRGNGASAPAEDLRDIDLRLEDMTGRMQTMAEVLGSRQQDFARHVSERLDGLTQRLGSTLVDGTAATNQSLTRLHERIAVIDRAQRGIADLSGRIDDLAAIFTNKQARGAFGQGSMEAIVADALPPGAYSFQATLSSGVRPDCLIHMPSGPSLAIDAKFPLESALAIDRSETLEMENRARGLFRRDCLGHIIDIRDKYLVPGETQDMALMFVPSESLFARLHEEFEDLVQKAHRARVIIVSPSLLLLAIQVVRSLHRDQRIEEAAHLIRAEVGAMIDDLARLRDRVAKLATHHDQARRDLDQILTSTDKLVRRGERIGEMDLEEDGQGIMRLG